MSDTTDNIIVDTATRIFQDLCEPATINEAEKGIWPKALWGALEESGLPLAWVPDDLGGAGATMADGFAVLRAAGRFAVPAPPRSSGTQASGSPDSSSASHNALGHTPFSASFTVVGSHKSWKIRVAVSTMMLSVVSFISLPLR